MYKTTVNNKEEHTITFTGKNEGTLNGKAFNMDTVKIKDGSFHIIKDNTSYKANVVKANKEDKSFTINVNGNNYNIQVKDKYDALLAELGLDSLASKKVKEVKAPMPGLVLNLIAKAGDTIKEGDSLLVLEAMKMENVLKSPTEGEISKIHVKEGNTVEKNEVLVSFK